MGGCSVRYCPRYSRGVMPAGGQGGGGYTLIIQSELNVGIQYVVSKSVLMHYMMNVLL